MQTQAEKAAEQKLKEYDEAIKNSVGADKAALAIAALETAQYAAQVSPKARRWAYLVSIGLPPFGLIFALRYFFSAKQNAKSVAIVCVVLTAIGGLLVWLSLKSFVSLIPQSMTGQTELGEMGELGEMQDIDLKEIKKILENNIEEYKSLVE